MENSQLVRPGALTGLTLGVLVLCCSVDAQQVPRRLYMDHAIIQHHATSATVVANDAVPLVQAITAIREEYGWIVSVELPPYFSHYDLTDDTAPQWRAEHPNAKGVTIPAGGAFQCDYPEGPGIFTPAGEEAVLKRVVGCYNRSGNPGQFALLKEADDRYDIVGTGVRDNSGKVVPVEPILSIPITMPRVTRRADKTIDLILRRLSSASGTKIFLGWGPINLLAHAKVEVGGDSVPARTLLERTLDGTGEKLDWVTYYNADVPYYWLSVFQTKRVVHSLLRQKSYSPVQ